MKKLFILIITFIFITGCKNNNYYIYTIIEEHNNCLVAINYPITNEKNLDKEIKNYINSKYNSITNDINELNIDYTFNIVNNRYFNITLKTNIYNGTNNYDIVSYIFDTKKNIFLNLEDIISKNSLLTINQILEKNINREIDINYDKLTFDENYLYFYFTTNNNIKTVNVPIYDTEFLLDININTNTISQHNNYPSNKTIDPNKPVVAITFDDGPSKYTNEILDILEKHDANATFFVLGNKVSNYSSTLNRMLANGNEIGNHSYNHKDLNKLNTDELIYQIDTTQNIIYETTGYNPIYLRPTYGNINNNIKNNTNLEIILWNVDPEDWKYKNSKTIANKVIKKTKDGSIILLHDTKKRTVKALEIIIEELKKQDYQFVTISVLKQVERIRKQMGNDNE